MTTEYKPNPVRGVLCTLIGGCCWGFSGNCGQYLFNVHGVDPQWLTVIRMITAGLITVSIVAVRNKQALVECAKNKHDRTMMLLYGIFGLLLSQYTYLEAINATNAGTATVLQYIGPVLVMVVVCLSAKRMPKPLEALSIVLVIIGTFLYQGLIIFTPPVSNHLLAGTDISDTMRQIIQNGVILYALAQAKGGSE